MVAVQTASTSPRIAVLFHRLGPYHHARLRAAARHADIVAVEFSEIDKTYAWEKVDAALDFHRVTLFHDREIDSQPFIRVLLSIRRVLAAVQADVVAVPGWSSRGALAALIWCRLTGTPAIVMSSSTVRDYPRRAHREFVKRQILRLASAALVAGRSQAEYLTTLGWQPHHIEMGFDVVDNDHFASGAAAVRTTAAEIRTSLKLPERYFLATSRFVRKKNIGRLLRAYALYRRAAGEAAWNLVLIGDGPETPRIQAAITQEGLDGAVTLPGFKQYDELPQFYGLASAFVLASISEQWGLVVNEAMASGLPVLVSRRCGCAADLVEEGCNGYTFDPEDVTGLASLFTKISLASEADRAAMSTVSREIIQRWSPQTFAEGLLRAAHKALG